jgi:hypothetical protein
LVIYSYVTPGIAKKNSVLLTGGNWYDDLSVYRPPLSIMGPKKAKKGGGTQSPGEEMKAGEKMSELDKEWFLIQIKSLGEILGLGLRRALVQSCESTTLRLVARL